MFVLRKAEDRDGEIIGTDYLGQPFLARKGVKAPEAPEGTIRVWAEALLHKPAAALAAGRLIANGYLDIENKMHRAVFVRGVRTICGLSENYSKGIYEVLSAVARDNEVNMSYSFKLSRAHWQFSYRIYRWFGPSTGQGEITDTVLTAERHEELVAEGQATAAELYDA